MDAMTAKQTNEPSLTLSSMALDADACWERITETFLSHDVFLAGLFLAEETKMTYDVLV